jgi:hypothetical protein
MKKFQITAVLRGVWTPYRKGDTEALEKVQKQATKLIPGIIHLKYNERLKLKRFVLQTYKR